ncbi:MAG: outer membrane beta-barrel protein [Blastocatellia bacterium]
MKKLSLLAALLILCLPLAASAQDEAPKIEIFGGYSYRRFDSGDGFGSVSFHGFNTSLAGNITKHIGIVGEFSRFNKKLASINVPELGQFNVDVGLWTYLFGPRATLHRGKAEPFVHALFGGARASAGVSVPGFSEGGAVTGFASALGGGLDVKVSDNFAIRVAQLDYLGSRFEGELSGDFRYSVGIVIRLGKR